MRYKIIHENRYDFNSEVFLEPHYLRFKPKVTPNINLLSFNLHISPAPVGKSEIADVENNLINLSWFEGMHSALIIKAESLVEINEYNPFNFMLYPAEFNKVPFIYSTESAPQLVSFLEKKTIPASLSAYAEKIVKESGGNTIDFLAQLTSEIHSDFLLEYRHEGSPKEPIDTFIERKGSCRDLTWMQINLLRNMGIAARFVSGYYYVPLEKPDYELHAWLEVFLPGAGWLGFDPSHGILAGSSHIPVAVSSNPEYTMPVTGSIRGGASSQLSTNLLIEAL